MAKSMTKEQIRYCDEMVKKNTAPEEIAIHIKVPVSAVLKRITSIRESAQVSNKRQRYLDEMMLIIRKSHPITYKEIYLKWPYVLTVINAVLRHLCLTKEIKMVKRGVYDLFS